MSQTVRALRIWSWMLTMPTLAELTLKLSQDINRNEHERTAAVAALDGERTKALGALPGAAAILQRQAVAIVEAQNERDETLLDVEGDLREAERLAATRRRTDEDEAENGCARPTMLPSKHAARPRTRRRPPSKPPSPVSTAAICPRREGPGPRRCAPDHGSGDRRGAGRVLPRPAGPSGPAAGRSTGGRGQGATASRENRDTAKARWTAAEHVFGQSVKASDRLPQVALAALAGATAVIADVADRRHGIDRRFDEQEALARAEFAKARKELEGG